jgi:formylglycine-generating enzyme required for sulfatase activity
MQMVKIPPGTAVMGPAHKCDIAPYQYRLEVQITKPFWMARTPVTQREFQDVMGYNPSHFKGNWDRPVESLRGLDIYKFCNYLSAQAGLPDAYRGRDLMGDSPGFRLPTEYEWEYACRAGTRTRFWSGDMESDLARVGWCEYNSNNTTQSVGQKPANPFGLYDMHGNVWEVTEGEYADDNLENTDAYGVAEYIGTAKRGGSFLHRGKGCLASTRAQVDFHFGDKDTGFRVARGPISHRVLWVDKSLPETKHSDKQWADWQQENAKLQDVIPPHPNDNLYDC